MALIELDPKTNVLALVSFVLSLIAIGNQALGYLSGPKAKIHAPSSISLRHVKTGDTSKIDLYATAVGFTNTAAPGYSEIVTELTVSFTGPKGSPVELRWWGFEQATDAAASSNEKFAEAKTTSTTPQVVPGGGAIGWSTIFVPYPKSCPVGGEAKCSQSQNFLVLDDQTATWAAKGGLELHFKARRLSNEKQPLSVTCRIPAQDPTAVDVARVAEDFKHRGWITLSCASS